LDEKVVVEEEEEENMQQLKRQKELASAQPSLPVTCFPHHQHSFFKCSLRSLVLLDTHVKYQLQHHNDHRWQASTM
jgi:hypothetical protein